MADGLSGKSHTSRKDLKMRATKVQRFMGGMDETLKILRGFTRRSTDKMFRQVTDGKAQRNVGNL